MTTKPMQCGRAGRSARASLVLAGCLLLTGARVAVAAECAPDSLDACRYGRAAAPAYPAATEQVVALDYPDVTGQVRRFSIAVRRPVGAPGKLPIVVWSHGGARGQNDPSKVGEEWGHVFTGAGYLFVAIAHHERDMPGRQALCGALGFDETACQTFKFLSWDRPHDLDRVLDWIDEQAAGSMAGQLDPRRLVYAGHSAGAGAALMVAGASRDFAGRSRTLADPRPVAFIGCSPQGIGHDGFGATSFGALERPFLTLSGAGDATEGHPATARRDAFDHMRPGAAWLGWIDDEATRHVTFDLESSGCVRGGAAEARCAEHLVWLASAALAFVDAYLRDDVGAREYLLSDRLRVLSGGKFALSRR